MELALYERALADTGRIVAGVRDDQLDLPTPCTSWDVRALLKRLVEVNWGFAGRGGDDDPAAELAGDRLGAYQRSSAAVFATFSRPETMDREFTFAVRTLPGSDAVWIAMASASVHGWDLAKATGQDPTIDPELAEALLEFMNEFVSDELRRPPLLLFAPAVAVPEDAARRTGSLPSSAGNPEGAQADANSVISRRSQTPDRPHRDGARTAPHERTTIMTKYAAAMPLPAGNAPALAAVAAEALGPRLAEHTVSRQRLGITDERCWLQQTPAGPKVIYYQVARDPVEANRQFAASDEPYDLWFKREFGATIGANLNEATKVTSELVYESVPAGADPKHGMAMALPIVDPTAWRRLIAEINGPRRADHDDFHRRIGATDDRFQLFTPAGDTAILYLSSEDMGASVGRFVSSQDPHDVWLKRESLAATGIDWNRPPQGPLPELVFSWQAS